MTLRNRIARACSYLTLLVVAAGCAGAISANPIQDLPKTHLGGQGLQDASFNLDSAGSVLYIRAQQLKQAQGAGVEVPTSCKLLITDFLLDAAGVSGLSGGGLLPRLR